MAFLLIFVMDCGSACLYAVSTRVRFAGITATQQVTILTCSTCVVLILHTEICIIG